MPVYSVSRRSFLKAASAAFAGSLTFPFSVQGKNGKNKKAAGRRSNVVFDNFNGHYSLRAITPLLKEYRVPIGSLQPNTWTLKYNMYITMASRSAAEKLTSNMQGTLQLGKSGDKYQMTHLLRNGMESVCTETSISTSAEETLVWKANRSFVLQDTILPAFEETGMLEKNTAKLSKQKITYSLTLSEKLLSLPQIVQAMMKKKVPESFAFLDEQCAVRDEHRAKAAETINISCASGNHVLTGFHQHGQGMHPAHYWLDDRGVPVFITRGLRSYALTAIG